MVKAANYRPMLSFLRRLSLLGLFAVGIIVTHTLGNMLFLGPQQLNIMWLTNGLLLGLLLINRVKVWPQLIVVYVLTSFFISITRDVVFASFATFSDAAAPLVVAALIKLVFRKEQFALNRLSHAVVLAVFVFAIEAAFSTVGALAHEYHFATFPYWYGFQIWWLANSVGDTIMASAVVLWRYSYKSTCPFIRNAKKVFELTVLMLTAIITTIYIFRLQTPDLRTILEYPYVILLFLIWAALRFHPRWSVTLLLIVAIIAAYLTDSGMGPFISAAFKPYQSVLAFQIFLITCIFATLVISSVTYERTQTQQNLDRNRAILDATLNSTSEAILVVSADNIISHHNKQFVEMWSVPCDLINKENKDCVKEYGVPQLRNADKWDKLIEKLNTSGNTLKDIMQFKDGRIIEVLTKQLEGAAGRAWFFRDITEQTNNRIELELARRDLEKRVKERTKQLLDTEYALEIATQAAGIMRWEWNILDATFTFGPGLQQYLGLPSQTETVQNWKNRIHPDDAEDVLANIPDRPLADKAYEDEYRLRTASGQYRWVLVRGSTVETTRDGEPLRRAGVLIDIQDRKEADQQLTIFKSFAEASGQGIGMSDLEGRITWFNNTMGEMLDIKLDDVKGKNFQMYFPEHMQDMFKNVIMPAIMNQGQWFGELETVINGKILFTISNFFLIHDEKHRPLAIASIATDITERKLMEEELRQHRDNLARLVELQTADIRKSNVELQQKIDERIQAEQALRESEKTAKALLDSTLETLILTGTDATILMINETAAKRLGKTPEEVMGVSLFSLFDERLASERRKYFDRVITSGETVDWEDHRAGMDFHAHMFPVKDSQGNVAMVTTFAQDITERKHTERELIASQQKYKALFEAAGDALIILKDYKFFDCNQKALEMFDCDKKYFRDKAPHFFSPPEQPNGKSSYQKAMDRMSDALAGEPQFFEWQHQKCDGTIFDAEVTLNRLDIADQPYLQAIVRDVTRRKTAEKELQGKNRMFRAVVEATAKTTGENFFSTLCDQLAKATGFENVLLGELVRPENDRIRTRVFYSSSEFKNEFEYALEGTPCRHVVQGQVKVYTEGVQQLFPKDKLLQDINAQSYLGFPLYDYDGNVMGLLAVMGTWVVDNVDYYMDILYIFAARVAAEIQRIKADRERDDLLNSLAALNRELENVLYVSSHDLRSPLVNIQGFSSELHTACNRLTDRLNSPAIPPELRERLKPILTDDIPTSLEFISMNVERMDSLVRGLSQFCRIGRETLRPEQLDMNHHVREIIGSMKHQIEQAKIKLKLEDLPSCFADRNHITRIVSNLIDNAIKYIDPQRPGIITITGFRENGKSVYAVNDNGIGIAPEHQKRIFQVFHRLEPTGPIPGEGLGLTIVERMVEMNHGKVWLDSTPGEGSTFYFSVPASQP